jgi:hypothetical protein
MASPKMCIDCDRVTFIPTANARENGWVNLLTEAWNDLWRCPWCNHKKTA